MQRAGKVTEGGERCRALANVINASIQSQAGTSRIHNIGPTSGNQFDSSALAMVPSSIWGSERHKSGGDSIFNSITIPANNAILNDLPIDEGIDMRNHIQAQQWQFANHLNIDNAANQLIAAVNQGIVPCISGLTEKGNDLTPLFSSLLAEELKRQGLDVEIFFAADVLVNGGSVCNGSGPTTINSAALLADSVHVDYRVSISTTTGAGGSAETTQSCNAQGRVAFAPDRNPPLTGIRIIGAGPAGSLCGSNPVTGASKGGVPSFCTPSGSEPSIELEVVTFKNTDACRNCLHEQYAPDTNPLPAVIRRADALKGTCSDPRDAVASCLASTDVNSRCEFTDPGSTFFCRLGEKHWVAGRSGGAQTQNDWQPCHLAQLRDYDGLEITEATVGIEYGTSPTNLTGVSSDAFFANYGDSRDFSQSDLATWARIRIQNPRPGRSYQFDVRAIDTSSRYMGPSFCGADGNNFTCTPDSGYGVAIAEIENSAPLSYPEFDNNPFSLNNMISTASRGIQGQVDFDTILMPAFGGNRFQCQQGSVSVVQRVGNYAQGLLPEENLPAGMGIEVCEVSMTSNGTPLPSQPCSCNNNGACFGEGTTLNDTAQYSLSFLASHECGPAPVSVGGDDFEWCQDLADSFDIALPPGTIHRLGGTLGMHDSLSQVNLASTVVMPPQKSICGIVYAVPTAEANDTYRGFFSTSAPTDLPITEVNPARPPGCISFGGYTDSWFESSGNTQVRVTAMDACGRMSANPSRPTSYGVWNPEESETPRLARFGTPNFHALEPTTYLFGSGCRPDLYAGCYEPVGGHRCWSRTSCQNRGAACHSNWDNSYSPSEAERCFDPRSDEPGLPVAEQQARAAQRCNTIYQCVDDLNRMGPQAGCPGYLQSCTLTGSCSAPAPVKNPGTCSGGDKNGESCFSSSDCPGTGAFCSGVSTTPGGCAHNPSIPCLSNSACNISDTHTKCRVAAQATCDCPNDRACNDPFGNPYTPIGGNLLYCQGLFGASERITRAASSTCRENGQRAHWYCGYGTDNGDGTFTITPADLPFTRTDIIPGPEGWTQRTNSPCVHVAFEGDTCDPIADGGQNFTAEGL